MYKFCGSDYYSEKEMPKHFPFGKKWFERARFQNKGIPYTRIGNRIFYPVDEVTQWFQDKIDEGYQK